MRNVFGLLMIFSLVCFSNFNSGLAYGDSHTDKMGSDDDEDKTQEMTDEEKAAAEEEKKKKEEEEKKKKDHGGKEHGGSEHGGRAVKKQIYTAQNIKKRMHEYIERNTINGVFHIKDAKRNNKVLKLKFVKIHNPVRKIDGKGFFACTDFQVVGTKKQKLYDLDFWLNPVDGKLYVYDEKIHKNPVMVSNKWVKKARYTFIDDKPVEL